MCMIIRSFLSVLHLIILIAISNRFSRQESLSSYFLYFCRKGLTNFISVWGILKDHFWLYSLYSMVCSSHGKKKRLRDCWAASRSHYICPPHSCPSVVGQRWLLGFLELLVSMSEKDGVSSAPSALGVIDPGQIPEPSVFHWAPWCFAPWAAVGEHHCSSLWSCQMRQVADVEQVHWGCSADPSLPHGWLLRSRLREGVQTTV